MGRLAATLFGALILFVSFLLQFKEITNFLDELVVRDQMM